MTEPGRDLSVLRRMFDAAEALAADPSPAAQEARLAQYRFVSKALAPAGAAPVEVAPAIEGPTPERPATPTTPAEDGVTEGVLLEARSQAVEALRQLERVEVSPTHRRVVRAATGFAITLAVAVVVVPRLLELAAPVDLLAGKPWRASSAMFTCYPDRIDCGGARTTIFFHTNEENEPWLVFDLKAPTSFSSATIVNRRDAAKERAVPLVLEVSDDEQTWRMVARRDDEFSVWRPRFEQTTARFVRLKVLKRTYFHLDAVRLHP